MTPGAEILIEHEQEVIDSAKKVLKYIKTFHPVDGSTSEDIDNCSDELCKIIASCETFLKIVKSSIENY